MKKLFILVLALFLLSGCSDYKEVNEMAIISAIGIDHVDDNFVVTLETFNNKVQKDSEKVKTYTRTGIDKSVAQAFEKAADQLSTRAYYSHIKLCVISEEVAQNYLEKIADFFIRSTYLRENFRIVVAKIKPEKALEIETDENPISSIAINYLLQTNAYASNYALDMPFDVFLSEVLEFGKDGAMSVINEKDNNFYIDGLAIFDEYKMVDILTNEDAVIYNILKKDIKKPVFTVYYADKPVTVAIYDVANDIKVTKEQIAITGVYKAKILEDVPNLNIKNENVLKELDANFSQLINAQITDFLTKCQKEKSDVIFLGDNYYKSTREKNELIWQYAQIKSDIKVVINKKGLVFNLYENN